jgi:hypothetical protein
LELVIVIPLSVTELPRVTAFSSSMHEVAMKMETKKNNQERVSIFEIIPQPCSIHRQISSILIWQLNQQGER